MPAMYNIIVYVLTQLVVLVNTAEAHMHEGIILYCSKSVLGRVRNSCMLVLRLCFVIVASQHVVDTRQMLYYHMIL